MDYTLRVERSSSFSSTGATYLFGNTTKAEAVKRAEAEAVYWKKRGCDFDAELVDEEGNLVWKRRSLRGRKNEAAAFPILI